MSNLLLRGADKDSLGNHARTPLIVASIRRRVPIVKTLLAAGADVSIRGNDSFSVLELAAMKGHDDIIEAIVEHGADVNAADFDGHAALHIAADYDEAGAVNAPLEAGADIELKRKSDGFTPVATAAYNCHCKRILALLQDSAKLDARHRPSYAAARGLLSE